MPWQSWWKKLTWMRVDLAMGASQHWKRAAALALLIGVVAVTTSVAAAVYPDRPLRLIVPSAAGGGPDTAARLIASEFTKHLGHQVVVDNRPGGAFTIGMDAIAKAASDGYTIGYASVGPLAINPSLLSRRPYDPDTEAVTHPA
jgi:tripartite-type tricarboxylate transporter receptor subunit TctC